MSPHPLSLVHRVQPPTENTDGQPPLLLLLHGVGSNENDLMALAPHLDRRFFVISARAPLPLGPGAYGWYHLQMTPQGLLYNPAEAEAGWLAVARFIDEATDAYALAPDAMFLMGFSQGAIMSLAVALTQPEKAAGVVAMSGRLLPEVLPQRADDAALSGKPYLIVHGIRDAVLPIHFGREVRDRLAELPVSLTYKEYDMAHQVTPESLGDIAEWLTQRLDQRKSSP